MAIVWSREAKRRAVKRIEWRDPTFDLQSGEEWIHRVEGVLKVSDIVTHFGWPIQRGMQ